MPINFNQFANAFQKFRGNPMQMLNQNGISFSPAMQQDPKRMIQQLMDSGRMTQTQYNQLRGIAGQIEGNSQFVQMFGNEKR